MKKASIQLSINFLVVLIIAIIIMGLGFGLLSKAIQSSDKSLEGMGDQLDKQMQSILANSHDPVIVYPETLEVGRGDLAGTGIAIRNLNTAEPYQDFYLNAECIKSFTFDNEEQHSECNNLDILFDDEAMEIESNDVWQGIIGIDVSKTAAPGKYVINVDVDTDSEPYYNTLKLYVNVK